MNLRTVLGLVGGSLCLLHCRDFSGDGHGTQPGVGDGGDAGARPLVSGGGTDSGGASASLGGAPVDGGEAGANDGGAPPIQTGGKGGTQGMAGGGRGGSQAATAGDA